MSNLQLREDLVLARSMHAEMVADAWRSGDLRYKLKHCQADMLDAISQSEGFRYIIKCARRLGKSYLFMLIAIMVCLRKHKAKVRYAAPYKEQLTEILEPILNIICADAPQDRKPIWIKGRWLFKHNGSTIVPAGVNNGNAEKLRGPECDLFIVDEAGTVTRLKYLVTDIAIPQFMDKDGRVVKGRKLLVGSSPPKTPAHEFTQMADEAARDGNYSHYDIFDAEYPDDVVQMVMKELKGPDSTAWKREALALDVVEEAYALCPEWKEEYVQEFEIDEFFPFYLKYEALDIGVRDLTVCGLAHYDFKQAKLFIHDEFVINGPQMTTEKVADGIRAMDALRLKVLYEVEIVNDRPRWKAKLPPHCRLRRVSDVDLLLIQDLSTIHGLSFEATDKGELEQMVNNVRLWVGRGGLIVHPRCKQTIGCLRTGVWNEKRTGFDRSAQFGHFDAFAMVMYLLRNVDVRTNPIPAEFGRPQDSYWHDEQEDGRRGKLRKMLGVKREPGYNSKGGILGKS